MDFNNLRHDANSTWKKTFSSNLHHWHIPLAIKPVKLIFHQKLSIFFGIFSYILSFGCFFHNLLFLKSCHMKESWKDNLNLHHRRDIWIYRTRKTWEFVCFSYYNNNNNENNNNNKNNNSKYGVLRFAVFFERTTL